MKSLTHSLITMCIFIAAAALLVLYLISMYWHVYLSSAIFWIAIVSMLGTVTYQCFAIKLTSSYTKVVLLEIVVTSFLLHMIYQIPYYGLRGYDNFIDMASSKGILSTGFVIGQPEYVNVTSYFPIVHILGSVLSLITGINLFSVAKWFPSLFDTALILLLYLLVRRIFKEEKIALLSILMFAFLENHILLSSLFIRETIALVLAVGCLYLYFSAKQSTSPASCYALSIVFLMETVFAHHLTSFMLLIFLATQFLVTRMFEVPFFWRVFSGRKIEGEKVTTIFLSLSFVALLSYWIFIVTSPLYDLVQFIGDLFTPSLYGVTSYAATTGISGTSIRTIRGNIVFYGFYMFNLIFGLILLYGLSRRAKNRRTETYSFTLFLFISGLTGFLSLYLVAPAAFPERFLMFGWLFGFAPLVATVLKNKYKWLRKGCVLLLIAFMLYNIYLIDPIDYNPRAEGVVMVVSKEDYSLSRTFDFSNVKIYGHQNALMAIYDVHNNLGTVFALSSRANLTNFDWVIIEKKALELEEKYYPEPRTITIAALERLATEGSADYNRIYDSNSLSAFKLRP